MMSPLFFGVCCVVIVCSVEKRYSVNSVDERELCSVNNLMVYLFLHAKSYFYMSSLIISTRLFDPESCCCFFHCWWCASMLLHLESPSVSPYQSLNSDSRVCVHFLILQILVYWQSTYVTYCCIPISSAARLPQYCCQSLAEIPCPMLHISPASSE